MSHELPLISEGLARHLSPSDIVDNAHNYPEMQKDYSPAQKLALQAVKDSLMSIELTHSTNASIDSILSTGIEPGFHDGIDKSKNTHALDRSLGLDQYTFMHLGEFYKSSPYGESLVAADSKELIYSPRMVVTPSDIVVYSPFVSLDKRFEELTTRMETTAIDLYLSGVVRGQDWLEILGRKVLDAVIRDDEIVKKYLASSYPECDPFTVYRKQGKAYLGEFKYFGVIPATSITSVCENETDFSAKVKHMIEEHGFAPEALNGLASTENWGETVGIDISKPRRKWQDIIEMAKS